MNRALPALVGSLLLTACASAPSHPQDPLEPLNRAVFTFNDTADHYVMKPVAQGYRAITPQPVRSAIGNFFDNIRDAYSFANHTLQLKPAEASGDLLRVSINSTFGLFGLIDLATPMGIPSRKAGFGDTLAHYGWKNSSYLMLPLLGPSTVRDGVGIAVTASADQSVALYRSHTAATVAGVLSGVNQRSKLLGLEDTLEQAALDKYSHLRDGFLQYRNHQVGYQPPPAAQPEDENIDDLVAPEADASAAQATVPGDASAAR